MFDINLFQYDSANHLGYYKGHLVPSATQLVDIAFPMDSDIPQDRIENAATRGTHIHSLVEEINQEFDKSWSYNENLKQAIQLAIMYDEKEAIDYVSFLNTYRLKPVVYEKLVFLLDENGDLICYGHLDLIVKSMETINFDEPLFEEDKLYLLDAKTTSLFNKKKTTLQESIYKVAYEQESGKKIDKIFGLWLRDDIKLMPLKNDHTDSDFVIKICKHLASIWYDRN